MICSVNSVSLFCLRAALVGYLCIIAPAFNLGCAGFSVTEGEEILPIFPPQALDSPYPRLLHERDVILYHNAQGQRVSVGSGTFANVTLGELSGLKVRVVVKAYKQSPFGDILREIRLHRYAEQLGMTPILIGLMPSGPLSGNISLVYEYVTFSMSLGDWLDNYKKLSTVQWLHVCRQLALALLRLHQHDIFFNDLHRGNVLIEKSGNKLRVYIIDFGFATYKNGKVFSSDYGNFSGYNFIAPEVKNRIPSTAATDIFALGYNFLKIAKKIKIISLFHLAHWCLEHEPADRPLLLTVVAKLDNILFRASIELFKEMRYRKLGFASTDYLLLSRENLAVVSERYLYCPALSSIIANWQDQDASEMAWFHQLGVFERCQVRLFVLDEHDLLKQKKDEIVWFSRAKHDAIRLASLQSTNQTVIVKEFYQVMFELIREETCITGFLGNINVSPKVLGILIEYNDMNDVAFVQEFYGYGVSLTKFISGSSGHEWDLAFLEKAAKGEIEYTDQDKLKSTYMNCCMYTPSNVYIDLLLDWRFRECTVKSYRRFILERISILLIQKIKLVHDAGYLLNNFRRNNILVKWNGSSTDRLGIDLRIIDLGQVSPISAGIVMNGDFRYLSKFTFLAPEVTRGHKTSTASDIYSLCYVLYQTMQDYFPGAVHAFQHLTASRNFQGFYSHSSAQRAFNGTHFMFTENASRFKDNDSAFYKYHLMLVQCLHGRPNERPKIQDLLSASSLAFS